MKNVTPGGPYLIPEETPPGPDIVMRLCIKGWHYTAQDPCECGGEVQRPDLRGGGRGGKSKYYAGIWMDENDGGPLNGKARKQGAQPFSDHQADTMRYYDELKQMSEADIEEVIKRLRRNGGL